MRNYNGEVVMPELPEVETMKRFLYSKILGEKIIDARVLNENSIAPTPVFVTYK